MYDGVSTTYEGVRSLSRSVEIQETVSFNPSLAERPFPLWHFQTHLTWVVSSSKVLIKGTPPAAGVEFVRAKDGNYKLVDIVLEADLIY